MKIALAQIASLKGKIELNLNQHLAFINDAVQKSCDLILFPELSLQGYFPSIASACAIHLQDDRLVSLQRLSNQGNIAIAVGCSLTALGGNMIATIIFQPNQPRSWYAKQYLHQDEIPFFIPGNKSSVIQMGNYRVALAICYESLFEDHIKSMLAQKANIYLACVAKSEVAVRKATNHYTIMSAKYNLPIAMINTVGPVEGFICSGQSGFWNSKGQLVNSLGIENGLLINEF